MSVCALTYQADVKSNWWRYGPYVPHRTDWPNVSVQAV